MILSKVLFDLLTILAHRIARDEIKDFFNKKKIEIKKRKRMD